MSNSRISDLERFAGIFKALSNCHRVKIFSRLASCCSSEKACFIDENTSACVGEIALDLELAPSTVSHHIKELHRAGLIEMERRGQTVRCWVEPEILQELQDFLRGLADAESGVSFT